MEDILARGKLPIVAGGTGMYIDNLLAGRTFAAFTGKWRQILQDRAAKEGIAALYRELEQVDPQRAARLHLADEKRIIRALEVWHETGETITEHDRRTAALPHRYEAARIGLTFADRADMWARIDRRVDQMMAAGLVEEVEGLLASGVPERCTAMQAIGYKEIAAALREGRPAAEAAEEIKLRSRQYAKRQLTWFRREPSMKWITWEKIPDFSMALQNSTAYLEETGLL